MFYLIFLRIFNQHINLVQLPSNKNILLPEFPLFKTVYSYLLFPNCLILNYILFPREDPYYLFSFTDKAKAIIHYLYQRFKKKIKYFHLYQTQERTICLLWLIYMNKKWYFVLVNISVQGLELYPSFILGEHNHLHLFTNSVVMIRIVDVIQYFSEKYFRKHFHQKTVAPNGLDFDKSVTCHICKVPPRLFTSNAKNI